MLDAELVRWRGGAGGRTAGAEPRGALRFARPSRATIRVAGPASSAERIARSGRICAPRAALPTVWRWPPVRSRRAELWRRCGGAHGACERCAAPRRRGLALSGRRVAAVD